MIGYMGVCVFYFIALLEISYKNVAFRKKMCCAHRDLQLVNAGLIIILSHLYLLKKSKKSQ